LSAALTYTPGSSAIFLAGIAAYSIEAKANILSVKRDLLEREGPYGPNVALAMASGAKNLAEADVALATTGIAGPDGGTPERPVGFFSVAAVGLEKELYLEKRVKGSRHQVVEAATLAALSLLENLLDRPVIV
jgi:nicotinamide-nucleotide amidase